MPSGGRCPHTGTRRHKLLNKKGERNEIYRIKPEYAESHSGKGVF